ncbi:MAG: hypothetical protein SPD11_11735 [Sphaerochaetaceae bacterium]|nr:hypothetical protein [Sphaerochaetaceae bacterium]
MEKQKNFTWNSRYKYPDLDEYRYYQISIRAFDKKMNLFPCQRERFYYLDKLRWHLRRQGIQLIEYCFMRNHLHILVKTPDWTKLVNALRHTNRAYILHMRAVVRQGEFSNLTRAYDLPQYLRANPNGRVFLEHCSYVPIKGFRQMLTELRYVKRNPERANIINGDSMVAGRHEYHCNYFTHLDREGIQEIAGMFAKSPNELHALLMVDDDIWHVQQTKLTPQDISIEQIVFKHPNAKYPIETFRLLEKDF